MSKQPAGFWIRSLAAITDHLIMLIPHTYLWSILLASKDVSTLVHNLLIYIAVLIFPAWHILYSSVLTYYFGGTFGKLLFGLTVVNHQDKPVSFKKLLFRHSIGYQFSAVVFGLGYLAILRHPQKMAWHDQVVDSKVIRSNYPGLLAIVGIILILIINGYFISQASNNFSVNASLKFDLYHYYNDYRQQESQVNTPTDRPNQAVELSQKAQQEYDKSNYQQALQYLQSAIGLDPQNGEIYHQLGQTLLKLGENDRAIEAFQTAVELQPQNRVFKSSLESVK